MKRLFLISLPNPNDYKYSDYYNSAVVVASSPEEASQIHPCGSSNFVFRDGCWWDLKIPHDNFDWCNPSDVKVTFLSELPENSEFNIGDVICKDFQPY